MFAPSRKRLLLLAIVTAFLVTAWPPSAIPQERELIIAYTGDIITLDPPLVRQVPDYPLIMNLFNGLVRYVPTSADVKVEPDLASRWEVSSDGRVYTFFLRRGVKFHRGFGEVTADDVKFSLERVKDPDLGSTHRGEMELLDRVDVVDRYTAKVFLKKPYADFLTAILAYRPGYIVSKRAVERYGKDFGLNPIGTGPYMFVRRVPREFIALEANPDYFRKQVAIKKARLTIIPDESVAALALKKGDVQYMFVRTANAFALLKGDANILLIDTVGTQWRGLWLNVQRPVFRDVRARRAVAHSTDKDEMIATVLEGMGRPAHSVIPPGIFGHTENLTQYKYDVGQARRLVEEAKVAGADVVIITRSPDRDMALASAGYLRAAGFNARVEVLEPGAYAQRRDQGNFDIIVQGVARPAPDLFIPFFDSREKLPGPNITGYTGVDDLIDAQRVELNPAKRRELLKRFQARIADDVPVVPISYVLQVTAAHRSVRGGVPNTHYWFALLETMTFAK